MLVLIISQHAKSSLRIINCYSDSST